MPKIPGRKDLEKTFTELVREHGPCLHAFARRITRDDQMAEDIIQEVFLRLWQTRTAWALTVNMEAWLYRVTENRVIDYLRKKATEQKYYSRICRDEESAEPDAAERLENREFRELLSRSVKQLPAQRQVIYRLHKEQALSYREIADEMQLSQHTVKNQVFNAIRYLRSCLRGFKP